MAETAPVIDPVDYHHAVETLKELLAFWLMVSREAPDQGMGHSFVHEAVAVMRTAEQKYGHGEGARAGNEMVDKRAGFPALRCFALPSGTRNAIIGRVHLPVSHFSPSIPRIEIPLQ